VKFEALHQHLAEDEPAGRVVQLVPCGYVGVGDLGLDGVAVGQKPFWGIHNLIFKKHAVVVVPSDDIE
jgi:hypothetical protein